jgi:arginase family enzyme
MDKKPAFFGCALDCDEREESIREKLEFLQTDPKPVDAYEGIMEIMRSEVEASLWQEKGSLEVPAWLGPFPLPADKSRLAVGDFAAFLDQDGCRILADQVGRFIKENIYPGIPCLVAVDHALTGGAFRTLTEICHPEEISLVVLDSHTDALPASVMSEAIQYDLDTNPDSLHDPNDPYLYNRPDSYNASSFLDHLLRDGIIKPQNLYIFGISDYPPKQAFRIQDSRIKKYVGQFLKLKEMGVTLVTKSDLLLNPAKLKSILRSIKTPRVYISIDLDVGANNALEAVRFLDRQGINEKQLFRLVAYLREMLDRGIQLTGLDLTEINPRKAHRDSTYRIGVKILKKLLF